MSEFKRDQVLWYTQGKRRWRVQFLELSNSGKRAEVWHIDHPDKGVKPLSYVPLSGYVKLENLEPA
jgi:hypothetical protein